MSLHLEHAITALKKRVLFLSTIVEENLRRAVEAVDKRDADVARHVIEFDASIDREEVEVEEECLKMLALYQPVANDLRFIVAVLKLNSDLERIGDLAVNIAGGAMVLARAPALEPAFDFWRMAELAQGMVRQSLDALVNRDARLAREVCATDDAVDGLKHEISVRVKAGLREPAAAVDALVQVLAIARHLERVGDHATNIAEDVIYMIEGRIVRHQPER